MQVLEKSPNIPDFDDVAALTHEDMQSVDQLISQSLKSDVALISQVSEYIVMSGGKRLRPMIVLLAARAFGYEGEQHVRDGGNSDEIAQADPLHPAAVEAGVIRVVNKVLS